VIKFSSHASFNKSAALVLLTSEQAKAAKFSSSVKSVSAAVNGALSSRRFEGGKGEVLPLLVGGCLVVLFGLGKDKDLTMASLRVLVRRALMFGYFKKTADIELVPHKDETDIIKAVIDAQTFGTYAWKKYITRKKDDKTVEKKTLHIVAAPKAEYAEMEKIAACAVLTRDLINENADVTTAEYLERTVRGILKGKSGFNLEVLDRKKLQQKKFG
jgi:leucyl aminopeptidase